MTMYEDMNPEPMMQSFFESEPVQQSDSNNTSQFNIFEAIASAKKSIQFNTLISGQTRSSVAKSFFEVLALSSKGMIHAEQSEAFGQITLTKA